jgi:hypothetical protein
VLLWFIFLFVAAFGGGDWSLDALTRPMEPLQSTFFGSSINILHKGPVAKQ